MDLPGMCYLPSNTREDRGHGEDCGVSRGEDPWTEDIVPVVGVPVAVHLYSEVVTLQGPLLLTGNHQGHHW